MRSGRVWRRSLGCVFAAFCSLALWTAWTLAAEKASEAEPRSPSGEANAAVSAERIAKLIAKLGDDDYFVRQRAQEQLARIGFEAFDALSAAENSDDIEIAARARYLVRSMQVNWVADSDPPEVKALLEEYDSKSLRERAELIKQLAALPEDKGVAALCRMTRFEKSPIISRQAALALMPSSLVGDEAWAVREAAIRRGIGDSSRPAADWVRNYLRSRSEPAAAIGRWAELAEAEEKLVRESPQQTRPEIAAALWRQQVVLLRRLDRQDEAIAAIRKVVAQEQGASDETLFELITWLVEQKAWEIIDEVGQRYSDRINANPLLLYALAESRQEQGDAAAAEKLAQQATKAPGIAGKQQAHWNVVVQLQQHHLHRWVEHELREIIAIGPTTSVFTLYGQSILADMLHDRGDELAAAKLLEGAMEGIEANVKAGNEAQNNQLELDRMRARFNYYHACYLTSPEDRDKRVKHLTQALDADPTDADVLIALYRTPDLEASLRERTMRLIKEAADMFRGQIQQDPEDSTPYNQLAWLIANTEGDQQEALSCSKKSLELKPNEAGYLDTLGRCYYALGDYKNAVKVQSQAVEINPFSGLMTKQLALFRDALAKQEAKQKP